MAIINKKLQIKDKYNDFLLIISSQKNSKKSINLNGKNNLYQMTFRIKNYKLKTLKF